MSLVARGTTVQLSPGWQARLQIKRHAGRLQVTKTFGVGLHWTHDELSDIIRCADTYRRWLTQCGLRVNPRLHTAEMYDGNEWHYLTVEPYLGPDCEIRLLTPAIQNDAKRCILTQLISAAIKLAWPPDSCDFRCEVKPRDFCFCNRAIVMVDAFPPVFARADDTYVVATRQMDDACDVKRQRKEVLSVTSDAFGIVRNLVEHIFAISPLPGNWVIDELTSQLSTVAPAVAEGVCRYLETFNSASKVTSLASRIKRRQAQCPK